MEPLFDSLKPIPPTDTRLNTISREISGTDFRVGRVDKIGGFMLETAIEAHTEAQQDQPMLVGLSAPEIGAFVRMIIWDNTAQLGQPNANPDYKLLINPRLVRVSDEEELGKEACHSTGDIRAVVYRATELTVAGLDASNKHITQRIDNPFQARIIQHEIDHLNGIRPPDRVRSRKALSSAVDEMYRMAGHHSVWDYQHSVDKWMDMKHGRA